MKQNARHILKYLILLGFLFLLLNQVYIHSYWRSDRSVHASLLDSLGAISDTTEILLLSSSSNFHHRANDTCTRTVDEWIHHLDPDLAIDAVNKGYLHAGNYASIIENLNSDSKIKKIIVEVNLRSFGPYWMQSNVETLYSIERLISNTNLPPLLRRTLLSLQYYDNKTYEERLDICRKMWRNDTLILPYEFEYATCQQWDSTMAWDADFRKSDGSFDSEKRDYACNIIKAFAFNIKPDHPRLREYDRLIEEIQKRNLEVLFVIYPEDVELAERLTGSTIPYLLRENASVLVEYFENKGQTVLNLVDSFGTSYFYESFPTEHYKSKGKKKIARFILATQG